MEDSSITVDLGLPELEVIRHKQSESEHRIGVKKRREFGICPNCNEPISSYQENMMRIIGDLPIIGKPVFLLLIQRRCLLPILR